MILFKHNLEAIKEVKMILKEHNKVCVVHPTGTGKAVIIAKLIEWIGNDEEIIVVAPSIIIKDEIEKHTKNDITFFTFKALELMTDDDFKILKFKYVFIDEFHRIGAKEWNKKIVALESINKSAKFIGTSATPIRYLDGNRDISKEFFESNVASYISLNKAIALDILPVPRYVTSLYSVKDEHRKLVKKLVGRFSNKLLSEKINQSVIDWEKANGLENVFRKHLRKTDKKFIIFCTKISAIPKIQHRIEIIFKEILGHCSSFVVTSNTSEKINTERLNEFKSIKTPALLFTVDKFNEGIHLDGMYGVNGVILLRETSSPIIFHQQIGRVLSVGKKSQPIIFDLVNNFNSIMATSFHTQIREEMRLLEKDRKYIVDNFGVFGRSVSNKDLIEVSFYDETKTIRQLFVAFSNEIDMWNARYQKLKNLINAGEIITRSEHQEMYDFIRYNKTKYKAGTLEEEKQIKLVDLGIDLVKKNRFLETVKMYASQNKEILEDRMLYSFLVKQRHKLKIGKLSKKKQDILKEYGFDLKNLPIKEKEQHNFDFRISEYIEYLNDKNTGKKMQKQLYYWVEKQRKKAKEGKLHPEEEEKLKKIGFKFVGKKRKRKTFDQWLKLYKKNPSNGSVATWAYNQRKKYKENKLSIEKIKQLTAIGFDFNGYQRKKRLL